MADLGSQPPPWSGTLAKARPDAFLRDLASSLNNLSIMLSALGRREEALAAAKEAVTSYRTVAASQPTPSA